MIATSDPDVFIEEQREGYVCYVTNDGRRWEVAGVCDHRGTCLVGSVINGETIVDKARAQAVATTYAGPDVPVTPEFTGCCPLKGRYL